MFNKKSIPCTTTHRQWRNWGWAWGRTAPLAS